MLERPKVPCAEKILDLDSMLRRLLQNKYLRAKGTPESPPISPARDAQSTLLFLPFTERHPYLLGHLRIHLNLDLLLAFPILSRSSSLPQPDKFYSLEFLEQPD